MSLVIGLLTFFMVLNCLFLILLVLIQLPKKEAGAGIAFGGGATDALFGAGSGNALTKMTKYAAGSFLGMALLLSLLNAQFGSRTNRNLDKLLDSPAGAAAPAPVLPGNALSNQLQTAPAAPVSNVLQTTTPAVNGAAPQTQTPAPAPTTTAPAGTPAAPNTSAPAPQ